MTGIFGANGIGFSFTGLTGGAPQSPLDIAKALIDTHSSKLGGLDYSALKSGLDTLAAQNPALAANVTDELKTQLGPTTFVRLTGGGTEQAPQLPARRIESGRIPRNEAEIYARQDAVTEQEIKRWPVDMQQRLRNQVRINDHAGDPTAGSIPEGHVRPWHYDRDTGTQFRFVAREAPLADGKADLEVPNMYRTGDWRRELPNYAELKKTNYKEMPQRSLSDIKEIVFHHTGGNTNSARAVEQLHMNNGQTRSERLARAVGVGQDYSSYQDIGYAYIIHPNGDVFEGRDLYFNQADVSGRNSQTVGIAFAGVFSNKEVSPQALQSARNLVAGLDHLTGRELTIRTHGELDNVKKEEMAGAPKAVGDLKGMSFDDLTPPSPGAHRP